MGREVAKRIGARIRERRDELGLTQAQVATAMHTTHDQVSRWERGLHIPRDMQPLADALKVDPSYFIVPTPEKRQTPRLFQGRRDEDDVAKRLGGIEERLDGRILDQVTADRLERMEAQLTQHGKALQRIEAALQPITDGDDDDLAHRLLRLARLALRDDTQAPGSAPPTPESSGTPPD